MAIATVNPASGKTLRTFEPISERQLEEKLQRAAVAFQAYRSAAIQERAILLTRAGGILDVLIAMLLPAPSS